MCGFFAVRRAEVEVTAPLACWAGETAMAVPQVSAGGSPGLQGASERVFPSIGAVMNRRRLQTPLGQIMLFISS